MLNFIKRHRICLSILTLLLIGSSIWFYYFLRDENDRMDARLFPIPMLSEPSKTIIEYKTGNYTAYYKCFKLTFKYDDILKRFDGNHLIFDNQRYNYYIASDKEFYSETTGKPHFKINIYKGSTLIVENELYMMWVDSMPFYEIENNLIQLSSLRGFWQPRKVACYYFEPDSTYRIEVINNTPLAKFDGLETFLLIRPDRVPEHAR